MAGWFLTNNTSWEAQSRVESQQQKRQKLLGCSLGGRHQMGMSRQGPPPVFSRPPPARSVYTQGSHLWHCWCSDWVLCCGAVLCPGGVSSSPGLDSLDAGSTPSSHDRPPPRQGGVGLDGLWLRTAVLEQPAHGACLKEEEKINLVLSQGAWKTRIPWFSSEFMELGLRTWEKGQEKESKALEVTSQPAFTLREGPQQEVRMPC